MPDPVVFIPGLMADGRVFEVPMRTLARERPVMLTLPVGAASVADLAGNLLDAAPRRFVAVGHGLGGLVALEAAARACDRITALVLVCAVAQPIPPATAADMEMHLVRGQSGGLFAAIRALTGTDRMPAGAERQAVEDVQGEMAFDLGEAIFAAQLRAMQKRPDQKPLLARLTMPVLVLAGERDGLFPPRTAEIMAGQIARGRFEVMGGAGHMLPLEMPRRVSELIAGFLPQPYVLR